MKNSAGLGRICVGGIAIIDWLLRVTGNKKHCSRLEMTYLQTLHLSPVSMETVNAKTHSNTHTHTHEIIYRLPESKENDSRLTCFLVLSMIYFLNDLSFFFFFFFKQISFQ